MQQIRVPDSLYQDAQRQAAAAGFDTVDDFIIELLNQSLSIGIEDHDHLFNPERLAHLDQVAASIDAGAPTHSIEQVREHFDRKRQQWQKKDAG